MVNELGKVCAFSLSLCHRLVFDDYFDCEIPCFGLWNTICFVCGNGVVCVSFLTFVLCSPLNFNTGSVLYRAAEITRTKGGTLLQMKLAYNHLAPLFLLLLQWMDFSCTCLLLRYLDLFHIVVSKVNTYSWKYSFGCNSCLYLKL